MLISRTSLVLSIVFSLVHFFGISQTVNVVEQTDLSDEVNESSGLLLFEDRLITHNDSGDGPTLYELDITTGEVIRNVTVSNATSVDWEDLCADEDYIYIGDFGNNAGSREDLAIFRVAITDYLTTSNDTVQADTIRFNYADQSTFEPAPLSTNFDAEAMIAYNDSLYLFSKNWGDFKTNIYSIPKEPGNYTVSIIDSLDTEGLITSAGYDSNRNEILLTGYISSVPFIYFIKGTISNAFSSAQLFRATPEILGSAQVEGCTSIGDHRFYISSENEGGTIGKLNEVKLDGFIQLDTYDLKQPIGYPIPTNGVFHLNKSLNAADYELRSITGVLLKQGKVTSTIDLTQLPSGCYLLTVTSADNEVPNQQVIIKN